MSASKFTPERARAICDMVAQGAHLETAAGANGISYNTLRKWVRFGEEEGRQPYKKFAEDYRKAEFLCEAKLVSIWVRACLDGDWKAVKELLPRRYPERWAKAHMLDVAHHVTYDDVNTKSLDEQIEELLAEADAEAETADAKG